LLKGNRTPRQEPYKNAPGFLSSASTTFTFFYAISYEPASVFLDAFAAAPIAPTPELLLGHGFRSNWKPAHVAAYHTAMTGRDTGLDKEPWRPKPPYP
jgi:hypothetical protein